jgi:alkanesulfonate monooxygenase SsuD/methylene tetrahydromethanopterin reductase-like flavin-dependent oxidoreductase (luciferase family)
MAMRKCLPPGTVVRTGLTYAVAETVTSDWARFGDLLEDHDDHDERAERLAEALDLVRGPPFEGAFSGRNAPYGWAADLSHLIEATVERAGHELATLGLDSGDLALADAGTARVLRCLPASIVARGDHLRLGSALGGPREVERRMRAARQALGDDVLLVEPLAESVGWVRS